MPGSGSSSSGYRLALPVGFQFDEYRIVRVLGQGGFGITYLAYDTRLAISVAIKEMLPRDYATRTEGFEIIPKSPSDRQKFAWAKQRFIEEARILARLSHANIVRVLRFLERHGTAYMVMEFVRGQNFLEWMRTHPKPTEQQLKSILVPLLDGLGYLHREGVLHRDISPENILITEQGRPMLLDFGSARATVDRHSALTGVVRPGYSPIEQYQTVEPQGPFTDLYALAGVTIHAITGRVPPLSMDRLGNLDPFETLKQRYRGRYHETFLNALEAAFAVRPRDRLQSAAEWRRLLARDLPRSLAKQTQLPQLKPPKNRVGKAKRATSVTNKRPLWRLTLILIVFAGAGVGLNFWLTNGLNPKPAQRSAPQPVLQPAQEPVPQYRPQVVTAKEATRSHPYVNPLGMEFVPVQLEGKTLLFCVHQTRKRDYAVYARAPHESPVDNKWKNPEWRNVPVSNEDDDPVVMVNWYDANAFCEWLSAVESNKNQDTENYRLPTKEEWSAAAGPNVFPWGDDWPPPPGSGNYADRTAEAKFGADVVPSIPGYNDGFATTSPVKSFAANRFGLFDLGSNVQEWCGGKTDEGKVSRKGASWKDSAKDTLSTANSQLSPPDQRSVFIGFRCVLEVPNK
ncbi:MAG: SUMF1/EgtB/PvdO family nonheme iron enzyme [Verrucomicrobia bacterium]|nr:SUMF1/EgtB/PvdO family nonheme iron enzyme [Verrucomicrobiota bacterium]